MEKKTRSKKYHVRVPLTFDSFLKAGAWALEASSVIQPSTGREYLEVNSDLTARAG